MITLRLLRLQVDALLKTLPIMELKLSIYGYSVVISYSVKPYLLWD